MKRLFLLVLCIAIAAFLVTACSQKTTAPSENKQQEQIPDEKAPEPKPDEIDESPMAFEAAQEFIGYLQQRNATMILAMVTKEEYDYIKSGFSVATDKEFREKFENSISNWCNSQLKDVKISTYMTSKVDNTTYNVVYGELTKLTLEMKKEANGEFKVNRITKKTTQWGETTAK